MNNTMINRIKNSAFGKFLRRIAGEETGAVMMEYVIVAVLVAAAAVVAIAIFGKAIVGQSNAASQAVVVQPKSAESIVENNRKMVKEGVSEAATSANKFGGGDEVSGKAVEK